MTASDPCFLSVAEAAALIAAKRLSPVELTRAYLDRIDAYDHKGPALNAILAVNPRALETAAEMDRLDAAVAALALHSRRAEGQLRHRRHADDRRFRDAGEVRSAR